MKIRSVLKSAAFASLLCIVIIMTSCNKDDKNNGSSNPTAVTGTTTLIGQGWATIYGNIYARNQTMDITFEYDTTKSYGRSIKANPDVASGDTVTIVTVNLNHLKPNTLYYYRVKAASISDTVYGSDNSFTTLDTVSFMINFNPDLDYGSVTDIEGNEYKTIQIGTQTWMAENLKATMFNDGTEIPFNPVSTGWKNSYSPAYSWYNNDSVSYGALYNWYTVDLSSSGGKNVCPTGWHVPTDAEWTELADFCGGENIAGSKLKETGISHWYATDTLTTNETGFSALPGGSRNYYGVYDNIRHYGYWWSSTDASSTDAYSRDLNYSYDNIDRSRSLKRSGFSVRCIKDIN